jgi:hypothetical protein
MIAGIAREVVVPPAIDDEVVVGIARAVVGSWYSLSIKTSFSCYL